MRVRKDTSLARRILSYVLIAQISDCHIREEPGMFGHLVDTSASLASIVDHLATLDPAPDVVLATGDLTDDGTKAQYALLVDLLAPIGDYLLPLPGNHDEESLFRSTFADRIPEDVAEGHCSYVVDEHPVRLIGLDTSLPGYHDGLFGDAQEVWLDAVLRERPEHPTLVFTHFPPFTTGINFMDISGLSGAARLRKVIDAHPQVRMLVAGHLHRPIQTTVGNTLVSVCPSTGNQLGLDLHPNRGSAVDEPPGYQLHRWDGERFVTHTGLLWEGQRMDMSDFIAAIQARAAQGKSFPK